MRPEDIDVEHHGRISGPGCICNGYSYAGHVEPGSVNPECPSCYPEGPDMAWLAHITGKWVIRKRGGRWVVAGPMTRPAVAPERYDGAMTLSALVEALGEHRPSLGRTTPR